MSTFSTKPPSKSVFVGNIPYGLTEEQIIDIFSSAGKVLNFRLVYDRETGRPKGFGFAEYPDSDSASSAVRNLNDYEIMNRKLRVDFSNDGAEEPDGTHATHTQPQLNSYSQLPALINGVPVPPPGYAPPHMPAAQGPEPVRLPPLPAGIDLPEGLAAPDAISRTLSTLPPQQLLEVLSQMKSLVMNDPATATALLKQAPQLSYAIFQALLLMNLVSSDTLAEVVQTSAPPAAAPPPAAVKPLPTHNQAAPQQYGQPPPQQYNQGYTAPGGYAPTPPQGGYAPPPQQQAPPQAPPPGGPDADALIQQVLAMPQEVIDALAPAERAQLLALRAQFAGQR